VNDIAPLTTTDQQGQSGMPPVKLRLEGLSKRYGPLVALQPTDLTVFSGELLTILGPSGSGKTTLLQLIAGLTDPSSGRLFIDDRDQTDTPSHRRDVGVVFQNYALFPHLTIEENIAFPLQMRRVPAPERKRRVGAALEMVGLSHVAERMPSALSGGQQQRIALARCLVYQPSLILMDEPLGAMDKKLRETMQIEIKRLHRQTGATMLFVTHDQEEALALSDRICLMDHAVVEQIGTPREIYRRPATIFAAEFIGTSNVLRGAVRDGFIETLDGRFDLHGVNGHRPAIAAGEGALVIRPEHMRLDGDMSGQRGPGVIGMVVETVYAGAETRLLVSLASGTVLTVRQTADDALPPIGTQVQVSWPPGTALLLMS
jgi:putative spermidine/putrescine transport system ATP-binding protein